MKKVCWQTRFPEVNFHLTFTAYEEVEPQSDPKELEEWLDQQRLDEVEVLYFIGLFVHDLPKRVESWLAAQKQRALIFVEEELGAFASFSQGAWLDNPQIHFHYADEDPVEALAERFPTDRLAIFAGKPFPCASLKRKSAALSALYSDVLYSQKIVGNVVTNFSRLNGCFDARGSLKNVPAIICGAGPSLEQVLPILRRVADKALVIGGGSAITALSKAGIQPHLAMALDPNDEELDRLQQAEFFEGPFLFAPRLHEGVFMTSNGPFGYLKSDTGGLIEEYLEKAMNISGPDVGPDLGEEAFSVTTLALAHAYSMGCNPILFVGVDLAYTGGVRYAKGIAAEEADAQDPRALEHRCIRKDLHGNDVETLLKWVMESDCIAAFAKKHPETTFRNCSLGGLGFSGVENVSLEEACKDLPARDVTGMIHQMVQENPLHFDKEGFDVALTDLSQSLLRTQHLCEEILSRLEAGQRGGKLILLESDFHDELAYSTLLYGIDVALSHLLLRHYPDFDPEQGSLKREQAKYAELKRQIDLFVPLVTRGVAHA